MLFTLVIFQVALSLFTFSLRFVHYFWLFVYFFCQQQKIKSIKEIEFVFG